MNHETIDTERLHELQAKETIADAVINLVNVLLAAGAVGFEPAPDPEPDTEENRDGPW